MGLRSRSLGADERWERRRQRHYDRKKWMQLTQTTLKARGLQHKIRCCYYRNLRRLIAWKKRFCGRLYAHLSKTVFLLHLVQARKRRSRRPMAEKQEQLLEECCAQQAEEPAETALEVAVLASVDIWPEARAMAIHRV